MDEKTGTFNKPAPIPEEKEDMRQEDTLAFIFGKRNTARYINNNEKPDNAEPICTEKTAVIDKTAVIKNISASVPGYKIENTDEVSDINEEPNEAEDDKEDDGQPFYIENTLLKNKAKKQKNKKIREKRIKQLKAQQSRKTFTHLFGGILLVVLIVSTAVFLSFNIVRAALDFSGITTNEFEVEVTIPPHATTEEIANILAEKGIINNPGFFVMYSRMFGFDGNYLSGMFMLSSAMTYGTLINSLQSTSNIRDTVRVTIPEGLTAEEIGHLLEENFVCLAEDFEHYYKNKQNVFSFERRVLPNALKFHQLEGYLFPDTYEFFVIAALRDHRDPDNMNANEREIVRNQARIAANRIYDNFNSQITPAMYRTMSDMGFTLDEIITLASMVQAEAATIEDKRLVASVFLNRLENPAVFPYLQSDPTVYYARDFILPHITQRNMSLFQPVLDAYDTYNNPGLPPGPINNPGISAIMAVLEAPRSEYLYFCANIETGEVFFAISYAEHQANLARVAEEMGIR
jgi:UPF0755 protein